MNEPVKNKVVSYNFRELVMLLKILVTIVVKFDENNVRATYIYIHAYIYNPTVYK